MDKRKFARFFKLKQFYSLFILVVLFLVFSSFSQKKSEPFSASKTLQQIPQKDREKLALLFQKLIFTGCFGHTLFGDKPISTEGYFTIFASSKAALYNMDPEAYLNQLDRYWIVWEQYKYLFPMKHYLLINEKCPYSDDNYTITLINKKAFVEKINDNLDLFQKILGSRVTGEKLFEEVSKEGANLFKLLHYDEELYGTLLGFGRRNAQIYKRFIELRPYFISYSDEKNLSFKWPKPSPGFKSTKEEYLFLEDSLLSCESYHLLDFIDPVGFGGIKNDVETFKLCEKYKQEKKKLTAIYSQGNILEITLEKLCTD